MSDIIRFENVSKHYVGVQALDDISLSIHEGEVLAIAGENGAGKSTLIKLISGAIAPTSGRIFVDGQEIREFSPSAAKKQGIEVIYQEHNLMPHLSVSENIFFGKEIKSRWLLNKKEMLRMSQSMIDSFGVAIDPLEKVYNLSIAQQQIVEIIAAINGQVKLLIMDEPTAPLTNNEIDLLFGIIRKLNNEGTTILYISHRLEEIFKIANRVTVLRDGKLINTTPIESTSIPILIKDMVGRDVGKEYPIGHTYKETPVLEVSNLSNRKLKRCSFKLKKGEILGIGGLVGSGRTELVRALFGADKRLEGTIKINGKEVNIRNPKDAIRMGLGFITEDRKNEGLFLKKSITFNISFARMKELSRKGIVLKTKELESSMFYSNQMLVKCHSVHQSTATLSGGNQQKVVLAKWLATSPEILFLDEPTRGIDVGAKSEIYHLMRGLADSGKSIIMISSEMPELIGMCDRILVMKDGRINGELERNQFSQEKVLELAVFDKQVDESKGQQDDT